MREFRKNIKGRGASHNPDSRFESTHYHAEANEADNYGEEKPLLRTEFIRDASKSILSENNSPDIPFRFSINPYRGCEHGCAYCYARPTHEYLGYSAGLDFESKILYKPEAAELLRKQFMSPRWVPEMITISGNTDCYQPVEREMKLTRACVEVMAEFLNPLAMITKNALVTRDLDLFQELAKVDEVKIYISMTTLDDELCAALEPRTSRPRARLKAVETLAKAGIPVGVNLAPMIPGLNDHEMPELLKQAAAHGAESAGMTPIRLPLAVLPIFTEWLEIHRPEKKNKVLENIRSLRDGKLNDSTFGTRMRGQGAIAENMRQMFKLYSRKFGLNERKLELTAAHFRRPGDQLQLF